MEFYEITGSCIPSQTDMDKKLGLDDEQAFRLISPAGQYGELIDHNCW
jgi:hypothetical protein